MATDLDRSRPIYTVNQYKSDQLELRPYVGTKIFLPNRCKMNLYNFTRYEDRSIEDRDSRDWSTAQRIRSRFGAEIPLAARERAWKPKMFYVIADGELFFRFEKAALDTWTLRGGVGYIIHDRLRIEFLYSTRFDRGATDHPPEYDENVFRLNVKVGLHRGVLGRTSNPGGSE